MVVTLPMSVTLSAFVVFVGMVDPAAAAVVVVLTVVFCSCSVLTDAAVVVVFCSCSVLTADVSIAGVTVGAEVDGVSPEPESVLLMVCCVVTRAGLLVVLLLT